MDCQRLGSPAAAAERYLALVIVKYFVSGSNCNRFGAALILGERHVRQLLTHHVHVRWSLKEVDSCKVINHSRTVLDVFA
jgi:hypothetical protein